MATITGIIFSLGAIVSALMTIGAWRRIDISQRLSAVLFVATLFAGANQLFFWDISMNRFGGTASAGKIEAGHFYVGNHGRFQEVPFEVYGASLRYERNSNLALAASVAPLLMVQLWRAIHRGARIPTSVEEMLRAEQADSDQHSTK